MLNNIELAQFCRAATQKPTKYMWGDWGRVITNATITAKAKQYPTRYTPSRIEALTECIGTHIGCDCTGLIKWYLWTDGDIEKRPVYTSATDKSASGWYNSAKVRGSISTMPQRKGLILYLPGHCGVYLGNGKVAECTYGKYGDGCVITDFEGRGWTRWCECAFIEYRDEPSLFPIEAPYRFENGPRRNYCYCDREMSTPSVGSLDPNEVCGCFGTENGSALVIYPTPKGVKAGWVNADAGKLTGE